MDKKSSAHNPASQAPDPIGPADAAEQAVAKEDELRKAREADGAAQQELRRLDDLHRESARTQRDGILLITVFTFVLIQVLGNAPSFAALNYARFGGPPVADAPWSPCAWMTSGDMQGIVTQCLAVLGAVAIAMFAAPQRGRRIDAGSLAAFRWARALRWAAMITAGVGNATAVTAIVSAIAIAAAAGGKCDASGIAFPITLLAIVGTVLARAADRPANQTLLGDAVAWTESLKSQDAADRIAKTLTAKNWPTRRRSRLALGLSSVLALLASTIAATGVAWIFVYRSSPDPLPGAIGLGGFLFVVYLVWQLVLIVISAVLVARWELVGGGASKRRIRAVRWSVISSPVLFASLLIAVVYFTPRGDGAAVDMTITVCVVLASALVSSFWLAYADRVWGSVAWKASLDNAAARRPQAKIPPELIVPQHSGVSTAVKS